MRLLSLDMSTRKTGWAIFDGETLIKFGLIECSELDIIERIISMTLKIRELIKPNDIELIVCEDVPVSKCSNLKVGKDLCILQGCLLALIADYNVRRTIVSPSVWRSSVGMFHTVYECDKCGYHFEDVSALEEITCPECGNSARSKFKKIALNGRIDLKQRAVEMANEIFNLNLKYVSKTSKYNEDDIAEAILIGLSQLKKFEEDDYGREN